MRPGQNRRMRGRNRSNKSPNVLSKNFESNGPDIKIRGTAQHIAEKYIQLARDANAAGDPVVAENYYQHAEHYLRIIASVQETFRPQSHFTSDIGEFDHEKALDSESSDMEIHTDVSDEDQMPVDLFQPTSDDSAENADNVRTPRRTPRQATESERKERRPRTPLRRERPVNPVRGRPVAPRHGNDAAQLSNPSQETTSLPAFLTAPIRSVPADSNGLTEQPSLKAEESAVAVDTEASAKPKRRRVTRVKTVDAPDMSSKKAVGE